jgi:hypothetical protein
MRMTSDNQKQTHLDKSKRPERTPLHKQKALNAAHRDGYVRRWVNESVDRVEAFTRAGWTPVVGEENTSDTRAQTESQLGSVVRKVVNKDPNASCRTAILMEIPKDLYDADQADKQLENDRIEASYDPAKQQQHGADYGDMKIN